eukprot:COSAG04_NODE_32604_length_210_cov_19.522523_1_plen_42_part_01
MWPADTLMWRAGLPPRTASAVPLDSTLRHRGMMRRMTVLVVL